jgi:hypothetical protein
MHMVVDVELIVDRVLQSRYSRMSRTMGCGRWSSFFTPVQGVMAIDEVEEEFEEDEEEEEEEEEGEVAAGAASPPSTSFSISPKLNAKSLMVHDR